MAGEICYQVARGLLLYGKPLREGKLTRKAFFEAIDRNDGAFRAAAEDVGAIASKPGVRFFDSSKRESLAFGPGAGLALGVSLGSQSLRAAIVDANGELHHKHEAERDPDQLKVEPPRLLARIREALTVVLEKALADESLLVDGALPFLGVSTAWPAPITREKRTVGHALQHNGWRGGEPLPNMVAAHLSLKVPESHAINDAAAAAVGVAYLQTLDPHHVEKEFPRLAMVLRLAGGIGASTIVVEPPRDEGELGITSGFPKSILTGGVDHLAGEIGHLPVEQQLIDRLNENRPDGLGELVPLPCSCSPDSEQTLMHLEAYASAGALAQRIDKNAPHAEVAAKILANPEDEVHKRALEDVGTLVAASLAGPVAVLNPATIVITGALAVPAVEKALSDGVRKDHVFGTRPEVSSLANDENEFIRVKGAGLVILRRQIFRRLPQILGGAKKTLEGNVKSATTMLREIPW